jgi:hypothetical protein
MKMTRTIAGEITLHKIALKEIIMVTKVDVYSFEFVDGAWRFAGKHEEPVRLNYGESWNSTMRPVWDGETPMYSIAIPKVYTISRWWRDCLEEEVESSKSLKYLMRNYPDAKVSRQVSGWYRDILHTSHRGKEESSKAKVVKKKAARMLSLMIQA